MPIAKGARSKLAYRVETAYGATPDTSNSGNVTSAPASWINDWHALSFSSESFEENIDSQMSDDIRSDRTRPEMRGGNITVGGSLTGDFGTFRWRDWFSQLCGPAPTLTTPAATALAAGAVTRGTYYTSGSNTYLCSQSGIAPTSPSLSHTSGEAVLLGSVPANDSKFQFAGVTASILALNTYTQTVTAALPSVGLAIEKQLIGASSTLYMLYRGCRVNSLEMTIPQSGIIKSTWSVLGIDSLTDTSTAYGTTHLTNTTSNGQFNAGEGPVSAFECYVDIGNTGNGVSTFRPVREASFTISNNLAEDVFAVNQRKRFDIPEGTRTISGRVSLYFDSVAEYNLFKAETKTSLAFTVASQGRWWKLNFPEVKFFGTATPKISGPGVLMVDLNFEAFRESTASPTDMTLVYTNPEV